MNDQIIKLKEIIIQPNNEELINEKNECIICYENSKTYYHIKNRLCKCKCYLCEKCFLEICKNNNGFYKCPICNFCVNDSLNLYNNQNNNEYEQNDINSFKNILKEFISCLKTEFLGLLIILIGISIVVGILYVVMFT